MLAYDRLKGKERSLASHSLSFLTGNKEKHGKKTQLQALLLPFSTSLSGLHALPGQDKFRPDSGIPQLMGC